MIFEYFGTPTLRKLIGKQLLNKVETILPALDDNIDDLALHRKSVLAEIFSSFIDANTLKNREFRRDFYNSLPESEINSLINHLAPQYLDSSFSTKLDVLLKYNWVNSEEVNYIIEDLGLPETIRPAERKERPSYETSAPFTTPFKTLKEFQTQVYFDSIEYVRPFGRFIIQMPTGSGKTRTSMEIISETFKQNDTDNVVFWLAHSVELCEQAIACFKDVWKHVGDQEIQICRIYGDNNALDALPKGKKFMVGGFQKLYSQFKDDNSIFDNIIDDIDLIIVDEAHKALAPTYKEVTEKLTYSNGCLMGLTATPGRSKDDDIENKKLAEFFHDNKITINTEPEVSVIDYLKSKEVLSHVEFDELKTSASFSLTKSDLKNLEQEFDFSRSFLKKVGNSDIRNLEILQKLIDYLNKGYQTLYFGTSKDQSKFINSVLTYLDFDSCHIDGETDKGSREQNIELFKNEELQIICNYGVLTTGFDAPQTDLVFIARPTNSIVLYSQMIGRGLRGPAIGGTEECTVCTVKDNIEGLPEEHKIYEYFDEYFD